MTQESPLFPVGLNADWLTQLPVSLSPILIDWLCDPNSLTARLKSHCQEFRVQLLGQHVEKCQPQEACAAIPAHSDVLVREVLLYCDGLPHVFARSLIPQESLSGEQQQLGALGEQPLGQVLFNHPSLRREAIEVARFNHCSVVANLCKQLALTVDGDLWGRRSLFYVNDKPLLVAEIFLPDSLAYQAITHQTIT